MRARATALAVAVIALSLALTGCTGDAKSTPKPTPKATATAIPAPAPSVTAPADSALRPIVPSTITAATVEPESVRLADAIGELIAASTVYVDDHDQLVAATKASGSYFGVLRTITLKSSESPVTTANLIVTKLQESGWQPLQVTATEGVQVSTLSSGTDARTSWFVIISADPTTEGQPVVSISLASPDLP